MRSFLALIKREYLEHRFAYVIAPAVLVVRIALASLCIWLAVPPNIETELPVNSARKLYDVGYAAAMNGWWIYALASLFFYYADSFHGDTRNNAMLFWKSMPQSDLKISASKLMTGLTVFPAAIFLAAMVTGLVLILPASVAAGAFGFSTPLDPGDALASFANLSAIGLVYFVLGLIWYAPFFAWVGLLSTIFGRWSIPLAFLVPVVLVIVELLVIRPAGAPDGSYLLSFLQYRAQYGFGGPDGYNLELTILLAMPIDAVSVVGAMLANYDWISAAGGAAVAALLVALSAEYRRRRLLT